MCTLVEKWTLTGLRAHHLGASTDPEQRRGNTGRYPMSSDKKRNEYDSRKQCAVDDKDQRNSA